jgi:hypothetical protein
MSSSKQVAVCTLSLKQCLGRGERTAVDAGVRQQPRHALQKAYTSRLSAGQSYPCPALRTVYGAQRRRPTVDLDQWNLVRCGHTANGSRPVKALEWGANAGCCGLRMCTSVDGTKRTRGCRKWRADRQTDANDLKPNSDLHQILAVATTGLRTAVRQT